MVLAQLLAMPARALPDHRTRVVGLRCVRAGRGGPWSQPHRRLRAARVHGHPGGCGDLRDLLVPRLPHQRSCFAITLTSPAGRHLKKVPSYPGLPSGIVASIRATSAGGPSIGAARARALRPSEAPGGRTVRWSLINAARASATGKAPSIGQAPRTGHCPCTGRGVCGGTRCGSPACSGPGGPTRSSCASTLRTTHPLGPRPRSGI